MFEPIEFGTLACDQNGPESQCCLLSGAIDGFGVFEADVWLRVGAVPGRNNTAQFIDAD